MLNEVTEVGYVEKDIRLYKGINRFEFCVPRKSGTKDRFFVSVYMEDECDLIAYEKIKIVGSMESKSRNGKLHVNVVATAIIFDTEDNVGINDVCSLSLSAVDQLNDVCLSGELCSDHSVRLTPLGKVITNTILRLRNSATENFYIPIILWGEDAQKVSRMSDHDIITIQGRFQSREYNKRISDTETRVMTAYEVSARLKQ